jgi:membrane associated rhomboid family serine protease
MGPRLTPIVRNLLAINVIIFLLQILFSVNLPELFGLRYFSSSQFAAWQFLTYMFIHASPMHLFSNILGLIFFGPLLENVMGSRRFLSFYMVCGMGAGFIHYAVFFGEIELQKQAIIQIDANLTEEAVVQYLDNFEPAILSKYADNLNDRLENGEIQNIWMEIKNAFVFKIQENNMVGASGAIFGILMGILLLFPNMEIFLLFPPILLKAKYLITIYLIFELLSGVQYSEVSNVAHFAHLGGALIAFALIRFWGIKRQF